MRKNVQLFALLAVAIAGALTLTACGGGGGGNHPTTNDLVIVPGSASIPVSQTGQFSAFLAGVGQTATWTASGSIKNASKAVEAKRVDMFLSPELVKPSSIRKLIEWRRCRIRKSHFSRPSNGHRAAAAGAGYKNEQK